MLKNIKIKTYTGFGFGYHDLEIEITEMYKIFVTQYFIGFLIIEKVYFKRLNDI